MSKYLSNKAFLGAVSLILVLIVGGSVWAFSGQSSKPNLNIIGGEMTRDHTDPYTGEMVKITCSSQGNDCQDQINKINQVAKDKTKAEIDDLNKQLDQENTQYKSNLQALQAKIESNNKAIADLESQKDSDKYTTKTVTVPTVWDYAKSNEKGADDEIMSDVAFAQICMTDNPDICNELHRGLYAKYGDHGSPRASMQAKWIKTNTKTETRFDEVKYNQNMTPLTSSKTDLDQQKKDLEQNHQNKVTELDQKNTELQKKIQPI